MRFYHPTQTTYTTFEAPEDKSPLELRPSLEKGEETHVRDCLTWHSPSPRHTYRQHGYRMYTHDGRDYWTSQSCGNPNCRTCEGADHLINRDVGYLRRNELGRTIDRGFSSKPYKLRLQDGELHDDQWTRRYDPSPDTSRSMRDPFNRPVDGFHQQPHKSWNGKHGSCTDCSTARSHGCSCNGRGGFDCSDCHSGSKGGKYNGNGFGNHRYLESTGPGSYQGPTVGNTDPYDLPTYRQTFPRIDQKDPGSVTYRGPPANNGYSLGDDDISRPPPMNAGGQTYRPSPTMDYRQPESTYQPTYQASGDSRPIGGAGGGGAGAARGNNATFPRPDEPKSTKPVGPRRELKGPNTAVAFTV